MLVTLDELKTYLRITGTEEDQRLEQIRSAAESEVKRYCKRAFEYGNYTEETEAIGGIVWLTETPVESVSEIKTSEGATLTIYRLDKGAGMIVLEQNYTGPVKVGYTGGLQNIPPDLKLAVMRLAEFYNVKAEGVAAENIGELKATYDNLPMVVARTLELYRRVKI